MTDYRKTTGKRSVRTQTAGFAEGDFEIGATVMVDAVNPKTGEVKTFGNTANIPDGWEMTNRAGDITPKKPPKPEPEDEEDERLGKIPDDPESGGMVGAAVMTPAYNPETGQEKTFSSPLNVPDGWVVKERGGGLDPEVSKPEETKVEAPEPTNDGFAGEKHSATNGRARTAQPTNSPTSTEREFTVSEMPSRNEYKQKIAIGAGIVIVTGALLR